MCMSQLCFNVRECMFVPLAFLYYIFRTHIFMYIFPADVQSGCTLMLPALSRPRLVCLYNSRLLMPLAYWPATFEELSTSMYWRTYLKECQYSHSMYAGQRCFLQCKEHETLFLMSNNFRIRCRHLRRIRLTTTRVSPRHPWCGLLPATCRQQDQLLPCMTVL